MTDLLRKSQPHEILMTPTCLEPFQTLKRRLISAPCLVLPEVSSNATFTVATYASAVSIATALPQYQRGSLIGRVNLTILSVVVLTMFTIWKL
jgi:hypothetical protein